ncbi:YbjN domain-containing protein [Thalassospira sp.]|uniref:YbjN domain-containing protein n=1 Tax=Thalassospira sp. TaxID=1912094 RepID=UPI002734DB08|nr:YbjN domain-containing protein [Thalassospira sp.]MDP2697206.1 YbjN domain-containing protein [Thalassospira sp.]
MTDRLHDDSELGDDNPLVLVEDIARTNDWSLERRTDDEIVVEIPGHWCTYLVYFTWREDAEALHIACCYDLFVPEPLRPRIYELLSKCNEQLWLGHFSLWQDENMPLFRHTLLFGGDMPPATEQFEELIEIAISECERFFPAFNFVLGQGKTPDEALTHSMLEPQGQA